MSVITIFPIGSRVQWINKNKKVGHGTIMDVLDAGYFPHLKVRAYKLQPDALAYCVTVPVEKHNMTLDEPTQKKDGGLCQKLKARIKSLRNSSKKLESI